MLLKPSEIRFSQEAINNYFRRRTRHGGRTIGETLDDICEGRCQISDIPMISVKWIDGHWTTADNRRLWVFRELERLGKCTEVNVMQTVYIDPRKLSSTNDGKSVIVRRSGPGGYWYLKQPEKSPSVADEVKEPQAQTNEAEPVEVLPQMTDQIVGVITKPRIYSFDQAVDMRSSNNTDEMHYGKTLNAFMIPRESEDAKSHLRLRSPCSSLGSLRSATNTERSHEDTMDLSDASINEVARRVTRLSFDEPRRSTYTTTRTIRELLEDSPESRNKSVASELLMSQSDGGSSSKN